MGASPCVCTAVLLACWVTNLIHSLPLDTTIDCKTGRFADLGKIDEHYSGDIETFPGMPGVELQLQVPEDCPKCLDFLEFVFISSITNVTVRTKQPLDTEALRETKGVLAYQITCPGPAEVVNGRVLTVTDVNDNAPVFETEEYKANVSEALPVGAVVLQVKATDADLSPANNHINYTIQPPSNTFEANGIGQILLKERLNYTVNTQHNFIVKAQDPGGLFDETTVVISIIDKLTPQFDYDHYEASVPENQVGPVLEVLPAPIKANTSEESNYTIIYSISEVSPTIYWNNITLDHNTGTLTVVSELDFEEMKDNITLLVKASLEIDSTRTTNTLVTVYVKNVNEAPVFHVKLYTAEIFIQASNIQIVQIKATDPDWGEKLLYSLVEPSSMFTVEPSSGQVYVVSVAGVSGKVTLQLKATDPDGLYDTTTVEVTIKESASNDDVVVISLNQEFDTVLNQSFELEKALERALGWSVSIISVSSSRKQMDQSRTTEILSFQREDTPRTFVSFIATEANGTDVISKKTVQNKLLDDKEIVLEEMQQVFGPRVNFDIVHDSKVPDITTEIILGTVISLICIGIGIGIGLFMYKKISQKGLKRPKDSMLPLDSRPSLAGDTDSIGKPNLARDTDSIGERPNLARDTDSIGERPNLAGDTDSIGERPNLAGDTDSIGERPNLARDTDSIGERPNLAADTDSIAERPNLSRDTDSIGERPNLARDTDSIGERPNLAGDTDSSGERLNLAGDTDSIGERPNLAGDTDSIGERPNLAGDTDSIGERLNLAGDTDSIGERPNLAGDTDSIGERPNLAGDTYSIGERPNLAGDTDSIGERPNLAVDTG